MKTHIKLFALFVVIPLVFQAQDNPLDALAEKYKGEPGVYFLDLTTNMFLDTLEGESGKMLHLKMLSYEDGSRNALRSKNLYDAFFDRFDRDAYIGLVEVKSTEEHLEIMVKKEADGVSEFIIAVKEEDEVTFIAATGNFDLKDLAGLKALQNCKGLQVMEKLCEE